MKVLVIGLDCAPPREVFHRFRGSLPNISRLMEEGAWGELESTIPPITTPAWMAMATSANPGRLNCFGFRNRRKGTYLEMEIANSRTIPEPTIWDRLSREGRRVVLLGVPQTYPPKAVNGLMVTSFLAPGTDSDYTYPPELKEEIRDVVGDYMIDCRNFRTEEKTRLLDQIHQMTRMRFDLAEHFLKTKPWDYFQMVEMGTDRIHHAFWKHYDTEHKKHEKGNPFERAIPDYYVYVDERIGRLLELIDRKDTAVFVVSDHGAKKMDGAICVNDFLIREGFMTLRSKPQGVVRIEEADIDWSKTTAWGFGGYYSRVYINVRGREKHGIVSPEEYPEVRDRLKKALESIPDERGHALPTTAFIPEEVYTGDYVANAPDLLVHFGDLHWRASQDIGHDSIYSFETEIGPDDAMHSQHGIFVMANGTVSGGEELERLRIYDVAPTVYRLLGMEPPDGLEGKVIDKSGGSGRKEEIA